MSPFSFNAIAWTSTTSVFFLLTQLSPLLTVAFSRCHTKALAACWTDNTPQYKTEEVEHEARTTTGNGVSKAKSSHVEVCTNVCVGGVVGGGRGKE